MEKLEPIKNENVIWKNYVGPDLQPQLTNNNAMELAWSVKNFPFLQEHYPQLYHLVDHLYSTGWGSGNLDLEGGSNIMRRGNVPVITDPVAGWYSIYPVSSMGEHMADNRATEDRYLYRVPIIKVSIDYVG